MAERGGPGPEEGDAKSSAEPGSGDASDGTKYRFTEDDFFTPEEFARYQAGVDAYARMRRWRRIEAGEEELPADQHEQASLANAEAEYRQYQRDSRDRADPDWDENDPNRTKLVRKRAHRYEAILAGKERVPDDPEESVQLRSAFEAVTNHPEQYGGPFGTELAKRERERRGEETQSGLQEPVAEQGEQSVEVARRRLHEVLAPETQTEVVATEAEKGHGLGSWPADEVLPSYSSPPADAKGGSDSWWDDDLDAPASSVRPPVRPPAELLDAGNGSVPEDLGSEVWWDDDLDDVGAHTGISDPPAPRRYGSDDLGDRNDVWWDDDLDDAGAHTRVPSPTGPPPWPDELGSSRVEPVGGYDVDTEGMSDSTAGYVRLVLSKTSEFVHHHGRATEGAPALNAGVLGDDLEEAYWAVRESLGVSTDGRDAVHWGKRHDFERGRDVGLIQHNVANRFRSPQSNDRVDYELWAWPTSDPRVAMVEQRGKHGELWVDVVVTPSDAFVTDRKGRAKGPSKLLESYMNGLNARELKRGLGGAHRVSRGQGIEHSSGLLGDLAPENEGPSTSEDIRRKAEIYAAEAAVAKDAKVDGIMAKARTSAEKREEAERRRVADLLASEARVAKQNADDAEAARLAEVARQTGETQTRMVESYGARSEGDTRVHDRNEDAMLESTHGPEPIIGVADGMGGHSGGYEASHIALKTIEEELRRPSSASRKERMERALIAAHQRVDATLNADPRIRKGEGAGTTAAIIWMGEQAGEERQVMIGNVGDSRVYVLRAADGTLEPITLDDSGIGGTEAQARERQNRFGLIETQAEVDALSPEDQFAWRTRHIIGNAIGTKESMKSPRISETTIRPGDKIFAMTDGIHDNLTDPEIQRIAASANTMEELAQGLTAAAVARRPAYEVDDSGQGQFVSGHIRSKPDDGTVVGYMFVLEKITAPAPVSAPAPDAQSAQPDAGQKKPDKNKPAGDNAGTAKGSKEKSTKQPPVNKWVHAVEEIVAGTTDPVQREAELRLLHAKVAAESSPGAGKGKKAQEPDVEKLNEFTGAFDTALREAMQEARRLREPQPDSADINGAASTGAPGSQTAPEPEPASKPAPETQSTGSTGWPGAGQPEPDEPEPSPRKRRSRAAGRPAGASQASPNAGEEPLDVQFWEDGEAVPPMSGAAQAGTGTEAQVEDEAGAGSSPPKPPAEAQTVSGPLAIEGRPALSEARERELAQLETTYDEILGGLAAVTSMQERQNGLSTLMQNAIDHGFVEADPTSVMGVRATADVRSHNFVEKLEAQAEVFGRTPRPRRGESERARQRRLRAEGQ